MPHGGLFLYSYTRTPTYCLFLKKTINFIYHMYRGTAHFCYSVQFFRTYQYIIIVAKKSSIFLLFYFAPIYTPLNTLQFFTHGRLSTLIYRFDSFKITFNFLSMGSIIFSLFSRDFIPFYPSLNH